MPIRIFNPKQDIITIVCNKLIKKVSKHYNSKIVDLIRIKGHELSVYPNPVKDMVTIELYAQTSQKNTIQIIDMSGRVVKKMQASCLGCEYLTTEYWRSCQPVVYTFKYIHKVH
jgi:hypothetical protein